ncbi:MAG: nitrous oxide reductase accessory protein NosL [Chloroflexota bacterium]
MSLARLQRQRVVLLAGLLLLFLVLLLVVSCSSGPNLDEPPEIRYGEDTCDRCQMIINEARYAAAYVMPDGQARRFDDIGGMLAYTREVPEDVAVFWVHDFDTEEWLNADEAFYVKSDHLTPMGFGIVAFGEQGRAESWANQEGGMIMSFADLLSGEEQIAHDHE